MKRLLLSLGLCGFLLVACGQQDSTDPEPTALPAGQLKAAENLFSRMDANTPYLAANLAALPEDLVDFFFAPLQSMTEMQRETYLKGAEELESDAPLAAAIMRELAAIDGREALESRGLAANGLWALHGLSIFPIMHWPLRDEAALQATLERLSEQSGTPLPKRSIDGVEVIWMPIDKLGLLVHHDADYLTVALIPDRPALLRRAANLEPADHAFEPARLQAFNLERDFTPHGSMFVDFARLRVILTEADDELSLMARDVLGMDGPVSEPACRSELSHLTEMLPRLSAGTTRFDRQQVDSRILLETEPNLAARLVPLADSPVGLRGAQGGMLAGGMAFDLVKIRDFARELVDGWIGNPPQCTLFSELANNAPDWRQALNRPIPPVVTNIQGLRFELDTFALNANQGVETAEGSIVLFVRNPQMLIGMAQMFSPEVAALNLEAGGEPRALPAGLIPNAPDLAAFIALGEEAIGLALGEARKDQLPDLLAGSSSDSTLLGYSIDVAAYQHWLEEIVAANLDPKSIGDDQFDPRAMLGDLGEYYERVDFYMLLTESGVEFHSGLTLKF